MPTVPFKAIVTLPAVTGVTADAVTNTFHYELVTATVADVHADIIDFYNGTHSPATSPLRLYLSNKLSRGAGVASVRSYDLADPTPRPVLRTDFFTLGAGEAGDFGLPDEVALVGSFYGIPPTGENPQSYKNRIYVGPFNEEGTLAGPPSRPSAALVQTVLEGLKKLAANATAHGWFWEVYSGTLNNAELVVGGWVDNAWDTQRRRGILPSARSLFTV